MVAQDATRGETYSGGTWRNWLPGVTLNYEADKYAESDALNLQPPFFRRKSGGCHAVALAKADHTRAAHHIPQTLKKTPPMPTTGFHYVYILRDVATGQHHDTGVTQNLHERLARHNSGQVPHTAKYAPWHIETTIAFRDKKKAYDYESYLKSGAGRAYACKHF